MLRYVSPRLVAFCFVIATFGPTTSSTASAWRALAMNQGTGTASGGACSLLTPAEIAKTTGIKVGDGTAGQQIPGTLGRCTWMGPGNTKVIVTLADEQHMQITIAAQLQGGGTPVSGVGSKAVAIRGAGFTGGGYILSVLDAKGGFGVSVLGKDGTQDRVVALAKIVEGRR